MKYFSLILVSIVCFGFCPSTEKSNLNKSNGFYVTVNDFTNSSSHQYIFENKDSVDFIFSKYFSGELNLGEIDYPITIFNGKRDFYVARVNVYLKPNGEKSFKHLKYPNIYDKSAKIKKRKLLNPVTF